MYDTILQYPSYIHGATTILEYDADNSCEMSYRLCNNEKIHYLIWCDDNETFVDPHRPRMKKIPVFITAKQAEKIKHSNAYAQELIKKKLKKQRIKVFFEGKNFILFKYHNRYFYLAFNDPYPVFVDKYVALTMKSDKTYAQGTITRIWLSRYR